jgi:DNA-binding response OmpR family regulator
VRRPGPRAAAEGAALEERILVVDDDEEIRNVVSIYMKNEGYLPLLARDSLEALEILKSQSVDLMILDVMMPGMDGIRACMKVREESGLPIIIVSAKNADADVIYGLASGADDYVTKPFNPLELVARVKSQLRRYKKLNSDSGGRSGVIEIGDLTIDMLLHTVKVGDREARLTAKEFDILELLARNQKVVFTIEKIYETVWKEPFYKSEGTVMVHITNIRNKIEPSPKKPVYIKTVWGVGYKI